MSSREKKIYDIIPPVKKVVKRNEEPEREKPKPKALFFCLGLAFLIISYVVLYRVEVTLLPKTEAVSAEAKFEINPDFSEADSIKKVIPAKIFEVEEALSKDFSATGKEKKETAASGKVTIYNAYSEESQVLVASTRVLSSEGKLFRTKKRITVPGGTYDKGKLTPGSIEVEVMAAEAGEEYNIGPSSFSIPGFAGTSKYTAFYAKSTESMTGGFKGEIGVVTKADLEKAKEDVLKAVFEKANISLQEKISDEWTLVGGGVKQEIGEAACPVTEGSEMNTFSYNARITLKAMAFRKSDLEKIAVDLALSKAISGVLGSEDFWSQRMALKDSLKVSTKAESVDFSKATGVATINVSADLYYGVDEELLKKSLSQKTVQEEFVFLNSQEELERAEVTAWPFSLGSLLNFPSKIKVKMKFE